MKIFAADLWPALGATQTFGDATQLELARNQMRLRQLIENVLLYDEVILPTDNFLSLNVLAQAFGPEAIAILIDEGILKFVRFTGMLAYAGAGNGLTIIKLAGSGTSNKPIGPMWLPTGVAAKEILCSQPGIRELRAKQIAAKVVHATKEIDLDGIREMLRARTYESATSAELDAALRVHSDNPNTLGIRADQLRLLGNFQDDKIERDDIDKLMLVARTQLELIGREKANCDDISTLSPIGKVLATRLHPDTSLQSLSEISDVPDLGTSVMQGATTVTQIVNLRNSKHWREFVIWFHENCGKEPRHVAKEYVKLLKGTARLDTAFFKTLRLLIATGVGVLNPPAGVAVAVADSFLLPKIKEPSPKYFIERLEQLSPQQTRK